MVNNSLDLHHIGVDWFIIDGAQQHTPAINKAVPSSMERVKKEMHQCLTQMFVFLF